MPDVNVVQLRKCVDRENVALRRRLRRRSVTLWRIGVDDGIAALHPSGRQPGHHLEAEDGHRLWQSLALWNLDGADGQDRVSVGVQLFGHD